MVNMSTTFAELSRADVVKVYTKIVVGSTTITNNDIANLVVEEQTAENNIQLGTAYSSTLKFDYFGSVDLVAQWLQPYVSFDNVEWCPLGKFKTVDIKSKDIGYEITAYDQIALLSDDYTITTPKTFAQMISEFGLELEVGQTVPSVTISESFVGTEREYLGWIAGYMGRNARINRNGNLVFVWYETHSTLFGDANNDGVINSSDTTYITNNLLGKYTNPAASGVLGLMQVGSGHIGGEYTNIGQADVNEDGIVNSADVSEINAYINGTPYPGTKVGTNYQSQEYGDNEVILNGFKTTTKGTQRITALISGYGETVYEVGSGRYIQFTNPFMTQAQLQTIWNEIITSDGFEWQPSETEVIGNPAYEVGDLIYIFQGDSEIRTPLMKQRIEITDHLQTKLYSYGWSDEKAIVNVDSNGKIEREISQLQAETERITSELNNTQGMYGGTYEKLYETIGGNSRPIGFKIIDNTDSDKYWRFDYNGLRFTSNDGASYKVGISNTGSILADNLVSGSIITNSFQIGSGANPPFKYTQNGNKLEINCSNIKLQDDVFELGNAFKWDGSSLVLGSNVSIKWDTIDESSTLETKINDSEDTLDDWAYNTSRTKIDGGEIQTGTVSADYVNASASISTPTINLGSTGAIYFGSSSYSLTTSDNFCPIFNGDLYINGSLIVGEEQQGYSLDVYTVNATNFHWQGSTTTNDNYAGMTSGGYIRRYSSTRRFKHNIHSLNEELKEQIRKLYDIEVMNWTYDLDKQDKDDERYGLEHFGLIAEDVESVLPIAVRHEKTGEVQNYNDRDLLNAVLFLVQEQHREIETLKERLNNENTL